MAFENFKETIWSKGIERALLKRCVLEANCNKQYQGEVGEGKRVKIVGAARPTIRTASGFHSFQSFSISGKARSHDTGRINFRISVFSGAFNAVTASPEGFLKSPPNGSNPVTRIFFICALLLFINRARLRMEQRYFYGIKNEILSML